MPQGRPHQQQHGITATKNPTLNNTENRETNPALALAMIVPTIDTIIKTIPVKYQLARFQPKGLFGYMYALLLGGKTYTGVGWKL
jgi:hypothetical protein